MTIQNNDVTSVYGHEQRIQNFTEKLKKHPK